MDGKKIRYETFADWVDTTGAAFMGLTMGCARCHDHKFDPISQRDYYGMQAIFAGSKEVLEPVVPPMSVADFKQHYPRVVAVDEARRAVRLFDERVKGRAQTEEEKAERAKMMTQIAEAVMAVPPKTAQGEDFDGILEVPSVSVLGHENPDLVPAIHVLNRGELTRPEALASPALPEALRAASGWTESVPGVVGGRAALARWLVNPAHPLTARVMVNRIWHYHFGRGIVETPSDFGAMGARPSNQELLDWLAATFVEEGWKPKALHRRILLSQTYRQSSAPRPDALASDAGSVYLWRFPPRRLEAEPIRDAVLATSGVLDLTMGGPGYNAFEPNDNYVRVYTPKKVFGPEEWRRMIYQYKPRVAQDETFGIFDCPDGGQHQPKRNASTTPLQALNLLNSPFMNQQAELLAKRLEKESPDPAEQAARAFRLAYAREALAEEKTASADFIKEHGLMLFCRAIYNTNEFLYVN
jgi:hypothetical protein